ncbi:hypothetical protein Q6247_27065, partial [Klebsiella pneumoniae]
MHVVLGSGRLGSVVMGRGIITDGELAVMLIFEKKKKKIGPHVSPNAPTTQPAAARRPPSRPTLHEREEEG